MEKNNEIIFAISEVGASHKPKGVPCQDYSLKVNDGDIRMIVVCDGHGSKTYVRSNVGSRLAAKIARDVLMDFVKEVSPLKFLNKKGAVTSRPEREDSLWGDAPAKPVDDMTEMERLNHEQTVMFYGQVKDVREQDSVFKSLFEKIYSRWVEAIKKDSEDNPFSDSEKEALGNNRIEKAYGSTLMAYVRTPFYWFAIHIGDGRMIAADSRMEMTQPVPWDCNCFQNFTTSLCNREALRLFRYAFDGTGNFPAAVFCCSDGIEDSYGDYTIAPKRLHEFYAGLLNEFVVNGESETLKKIADFLPILSEKGSRDDMSLAAIIDVDVVKTALKYYEKQQKIDALKSDLETIAKEIEEKDSARKNDWKEMLQKNNLANAEE